MTEKKHHILGADFVRSISALGIIAYHFSCTILGMDGYFSYRVQPNYYILGEWFLGAIIFLYILYPIFLKLIKKPVFCSVCFVMLYIWQVLTPIFKINDYCNLIYCGLGFWMGMLFMKNYRIIEENKKILCAISFMLVFVLIFIKLPVKANFVIHIVGMGMFILLFFGGEIILKRSRRMNLIFSKISMISYAIFLIHHVILYKLLARFLNLNIITTIALLFVSFVVSFVAAYIIYFINKKITLLVKRHRG